MTDSIPQPNPNAARPSPTSTDHSDIMSTVGPIHVIRPVAPSNNGYSALAGNLSGAERALNIALKPAMAPIADPLIEIDRLTGDTEGTGL